MRLSAEAMRRLMSYPWPGNIRELENTMQRLVVLADDDEIGARDLPMHVLMHDAPDETAAGGLTLDEEVEALERRRIIAALRTNAHVQAKAARDAGNHGSAARLQDAQVRHRGVARLAPADG